MLFIANSTTQAVAGQTSPVGPVYIASTRQMASSNLQAMTALPELQVSCTTDSRMTDRFQYSTLIMKIDDMSQASKIFCMYIYCRTTSVLHTKSNDWRATAPAAHMT